MASSSVQLPQNTPQLIPTHPKLSEMPESSDVFTSYNLRNELFKAAMSDNWKKVLELYTNNKQVREEKITHAMDTVLHVALSGATTTVVLQLLQIVQEKSTSEERQNILGSQNEGGDTPLHLAAAFGLVQVCGKMAQISPEMVTETRNKFGETPLFTAVRQGKRKTFFALEAVIHKQQNLTIDKDCLSQRDTTHCRRRDGNNILHYAIKGEHFGLAYEIIDLYPRLMNFVNASGESPLHTLANKPLFLKSGIRFGTFDTIIYYCMRIEQFKLKNNLEVIKQHLQLEIPKDEKESQPLPATYKASGYLHSSIKGLKNIATFNAVSSCLRTGICKPCFADEENQAGTQKGDASRPSENQEQRRQIPANNCVPISFFKNIYILLSTVLWIWIGLRRLQTNLLRRLQTIRKYRKKQNRALKVMKELVDNSTLWLYEDASGGMKPPHSSMEQIRAFEAWPPPQIQSDEETTDLGLEEKPTSNVTNAVRDIMIAAIEEIREESRDDVLKKILEKLSLEAKYVHKKESTNAPNTPSPVLLAAKRGIKEMVQRILDKFPVAILDQDKDEKNIVLLAAEHRCVNVYKFMLGFVRMKKHVFGKVDKEGNSVLHLTAKLSQSRPWSIPGAALQMQWECKWYNYVLNSMDREVFSTTNNEGKTAQEIFSESHDTLVKDGSSWLTNTSQSCSVVAGLVATVAFASASTVPGGSLQSGFPVLRHEPVFQVFAISSLVAVCLSVTSLGMFLAILSSRYQVRDFETGIPGKLILGLTSLFMSVAAMIVSFCAGDFFVVVSHRILAIMCLPLSFFVVALLPLYNDLIKATTMEVPERIEKMQEY